MASLSQYEKLLAKSYDKKKYSTAPQYAQLLRHNFDAADAAKFLLDKYGRAALYATGQNRSFEDFCKTVKLGASLHDLGKANDHFHNMVDDPTNSHRQMLRHEHISGICMYLIRPIHDWLKPLGKIFEDALVGVLGHHKKFHIGTIAEEVPPMTVAFDRPEFAFLLQNISREFGLPNPPSFSSGFSISKESADKMLEMLKSKLDKLYGTDTSFEDRVYLGVVKSFIISADVLSSAFAKKHRDRYVINEVLTDAVAESLTTMDVDTLIRSKIPAYDPAKPKKEIFKECQMQMAESKSRTTLTIAGCGSGKTAGSLLNLRSWVEGDEPKERGFTLLPTTGTTTEYYAEYAMALGHDSCLFHSRAEIDLETLSSIDNDSKNSSDIFQRIEAARLFGCKIAVSTCDTVLGIMGYNSKGMISLPAILSSHINFDEIHAYDKLMFASLLAFLKAFPNVPVVLMSASLSESRIEAIRKCRPDINLIEGPKDHESIIRYRIVYDPTPQMVEDEIKRSYAKGGKILCVKNQVRWANEAYVAYKRDYSNVDVYHSRFKYLHRSLRHRSVIDKFRSKTFPSILIGTQVVEISLDISADLGITDLADPASLIQRLGRFGRYLVIGDEPITVFIQKLPNNKYGILPYTQDEIDAGHRFCQILNGRRVSQLDLKEAFNQVYDEFDIDWMSLMEQVPFLHSRWETAYAPIRDNGTTVNVILEKDFAQCNDRYPSGDPTAKWLRNFEVPIPVKIERMQEWKKCGHVYIAPEKDVRYTYNELTKEGTGAEWVSL